MEYSKDIKNLFRMAEREMMSLNHPYVGSEHLLLALLKSNWELVKDFNRLGLTYDKFRNELIGIVGRCKKKSEVVLYTPLLKRVIELAENDAIENGEGIEYGHLFKAIIEEGEGIAIRVLLAMDLPLNKLYNVVNNKNKLGIKEGILLNEIKNDEILIGRDKELRELEEILLRKNKCNPLLIGKAGVGKSAIVEEFVRRVNNNDVPERLKNVKVIKLDMGSLVAGTKYRGEFEEKITTLLEEVNNRKDIVLFIDEIHTLVNAGGAEGAVSACDIFKPYLARGSIKLIGATTFREYKNSIFRDKALNRRFQLIEVLEPSFHETMDIVKGLRHSYEEFHDVIIGDDVINELVKCSNEYIYNKSNPDKTLDLLDSVCVYVSCKSLTTGVEDKMTELKNMKKAKDDAICAQKYDTAKEICQREDELKKEIKSLKKNSRVIKITDIHEVIKRKYKMVHDKKEIKNIVDKYELMNKEFVINSIMNKFLEIEEDKEVLNMCKEIFGKQLIIIDGIDYRENSSIYKLIGVPKGYQGYREEYKLEIFKDNPFGCLYIKNINEMALNVQELINKIIKDRIITDQEDDKISFKNVFIVNNKVRVKSSIGFGL